MRSSHVVAYCLPPMVWNVVAWCAMICSRVAFFGGGFSSGASARTSGGRRNGWLVLEKMMVTLANRSGCDPAATWLIMPPIEAPTRWARSSPRWSMRPIVSSAMSTIVYGTELGRPSSWRTRRSSTLLVTRAPVILVDSPMSRLSNRMTRWPASSRRRQNGIDHVSS